VEEGQSAEVLAGGTLSFHKGDYVRMIIAPNARMGTVEETKLEQGRVLVLFRLDPRFKAKLPDFYVGEEDLEHCQRPSDAQVKTINDYTTGL
jgi:hypothetical protein